jgi:LysR family nitrogen assimilation transcriptional regulator
MSGYIREWVAGGRLDFGVLVNAEAHSGLVSRPLLTDDLVLVGPSRAFRTAGRGRSQPRLPLAAVAGFDLILPCQPHGLREFGERTAEANDLILQVACDFDGLAQSKVLVAQGLGYTILPYAAAHEEVRSVAVIVSPTIERSISLAWARLHARTPAEVKAADHLVAIVKGLVGQGAWPGTLHV